MHWTLPPVSNVTCCVGLQCEINYLYRLNTSLISDCNNLGKSCTKSGPLCKLCKLEMSWKKNLQLHKSSMNWVNCVGIRQTFILTSIWTQWHAAAEKCIQKTQRKVNGVRIEPSISAAVYRNDFTEIKAKLISSRNRERHDSLKSKACESFESKGLNFVCCKLHRRNFAINFSQPRNDF